MKLLLLLSVTVAFVATGTEGLQCFECTGSADCSAKETCPASQDAACLIKREGLEIF